MALAKGSTLRATLDFLEHETRPGVVEEVLGRLDAGLRREIERAAPTDELPFDRALALWRAADAVLGAEEPQWPERAGEYAIGRTGAQLYAGILKKKTPMEFLTQPIKLFRLYYHTGDIEVVQTGEQCAVLRLVDFDTPDRLFCRRQTGGLRKALELAGGRDARVRQVRCELEGDAFCEWELTWRA